MTRHALVTYRLRALGALLAIGLLAVGCGSGGTSNGGAGSKASAAAVDLSVLGTPNPAKGAPVKLGLISDGRFATADRAYESDVAQATVSYLNKYKGGLAGRPIQLVTCIDQASPAKAADCGNQMVKDNVVAVAIGSEAVEDNFWEPLHAAHIPVMFYGASSQKVILDSTSTFDLSSPTLGLVDLPASIARDSGKKKVTVVVIDIPAAVTLYKTIGPALFQKYGVTLNLVPIAPGTADMTPQMQKLATGDPGVVHVIGTDSFCIAAFNGMRAVGFSGTVSTIAQCLTDATLKAVPGSFLKGMKVAATAPTNDASDPSVKLYNAVIKTYAHGTPRSMVGGMSMFTAVAGLAAGVEGMTGDVTPASITKALKAMPQKELPGSGGQQFRCNGKAISFAPAVCVHSGLVTTLDAQGKATAYQKVNDTPIEN